MARKSDEKKLYDELTIKMLVRLCKICTDPFDLFYHMLKTARLQSFSVILLQSDMENFADFLKKNKRKTDVLYEVEGEDDLYVLLCQETQVDGGFYFMKRLAQIIEEAKMPLFRAAIIGVENTRYEIEELLFFIVDTYLKLDEDLEKQFVFRSVQ
ncbi:hypothetical protein [Nitratifractor sp.]